MGKLYEILRLTRIEHSLMLVIAVLGAELLAGGLPPSKILALSLITPVFISMGSFAINDYFDIKVDKANKKDRPLVTGALKKSDALYITFITMLIGILASALINTTCLAIAVVFAALSLLYSYKLKELLIVGNIYIAFSMVIPFFYGNFVVSPLLNTGVVFVSAMVFLSGLGREIHGSIRDLKGDAKERGVNSIPKFAGVRNASIIAAVFYSVAIEISLYMLFVLPPFAYNPLYAIPVMISGVMFLYVAGNFLNEARARQKFYDRMRDISLLGMALALVGILLTGLWHI